MTQTCLNRSYLHFPAVFACRALGLCCFTVDSVNVLDKKNCVRNTNSKNKKMCQTRNEIFIYIFTMVTTCLESLDCLLVFDAKLLGNVLINQNSLKLLRQVLASVFQSVWAGTSVKTEDPEYVKCSKVYKHMYFLLTWTEQLIVSVTIKLPQDDLKSEGHLFWRWCFRWCGCLRSSSSWRWRCCSLRSAGPEPPSA